MRKGKTAAVCPQMSCILPPPAHVVMVTYVTTCGYGNALEIMKSLPFHGNDKQTTTFLTLAAGSKLFVFCSIKVFIPSDTSL